MKCSLGYTIKSLKQEEKIKSILNAVDTFTCERFGQYFTAEEINSAPSCHQLVYNKMKSLSKSSFGDECSFINIKLLVVSLLLPQLVKKHLHMIWRRKIMDPFYSVIYSYSHKKVERLVHKKPIRLLLSDFFNSQDFEEMLHNDSTLSKRILVYKKHVEVLMTLKSATPEDNESVYGSEK